MPHIFLNWKPTFIISLTLLFAVVVNFCSFSQDLPDSPYYEEFDEKLTGRIYTSRKYTNLYFKDDVSSKVYRYLPNSTLNLGLGVTYRAVSFNLAHGFGFLNPDRNTGSTKYLDLQTHIYPKKWVIDIFAQFYRGYYLEERGLGMQSEDLHYILPDMKVRKIGANVQYLFNGDKLSLRASFLQSEWQKKSAGSFLAGFEIYEGRATNDGLILPQDMMLGDPNRNFSSVRFFELGPNAGYVYTLVIKKHFFITGSASTNLGLGRTAMSLSQEKSSQWGINSNIFLRGFAGYNSRVWSINANYVHNRVRLIGVADFTSELWTGNYRVNFVYRFNAGEKLKNSLRMLK